MAAGGGLARPEPTGYGHTDSDDAYLGDTSTGGLRVHQNEEKYEPKNWGEAWDERHREPGRKRRVPADDVERLKPKPDWPTRMEAGMSWKTALFGDQMKASDLDRGDGGVFSYQGRPVAIRHENMMVIVDRPLAPLVTAVLDLVASAEQEGLRVERLEYSKLVNFIRQVRRIEQSKQEGTPMSGIARTKRTKKAKKGNGISAGHKKIINELLEREDAKPTGDAVRLAESNPRKEFARYQIPTDRGLKDIEIWGDRVKVRSESTYGFSKKAQDDMDGLPDRVAPDDGPDALPETGMPVGVEDEMPADEEVGDMPEGLPLRISVSVSSPEGMAEEEIISMLDEVLRDPDVSDMINDRLTESGLSLSIVAIDLDDEDDEDDEDIDDDMGDMDDEYEGLADEVVDPGEGDVEEVY